MKKGVIFMKKIRVGIAGTGYTVGMANAHVIGYQACQQDCELTALYDIVPGRATQWAEEKKLDVKICQTFDELLDCVDAVSIVTPNYAHVPLVIRALERGKHVLCEKPLSTDAETCKQAVNYGKCTDRVKMIGFSYRGIPAVCWMRKQIQDGKLGRIFTWRETLGGCRIANPQVQLEWRMQKTLSGSGALADFGCHMVDLCEWTLSGTSGKIKAVQGFVSCTIPERNKIFEEGKGKVTNDDNAVFNVEFENGTLASFVASRLGVRRHTIEVYGEGGMMLFRDDRPNEVEVFFKEKNGGYNGDAEIIQVPEEMVVSPWFNAEIQEFIECIKTGKQPERNFERALYIQEILDKIMESSESGKTIEL